MATMTLRGIDDATAETLKKLAAEERMSMNAFILRTLRAALKMGKGRRNVEHHDLDKLAGTWDERDEAEFASNTVAFEAVDEGLWK